MPFLTKMILPVLALVSFTALGAAPVRFKAAVSVPAQKFVLDAISGGDADVIILADGSIDPHLFEPSPNLIDRLCACRFFFTIGLPFEGKLVRRLHSLSPGVEPVCVGRCRTGHSDRYSGTTAISGGQGIPWSRGCCSMDSDPHGWTSPAGLRLMAVRMCMAISKANPEKSAVYSNNLSVFLAEMNQLSDEFRKKIKGSGVKAFAAYHPAWTSFAEEFGLIQISIEKNGIEPGIRRIAAISEAFKNNHIGTILVKNASEAEKASGIASKNGVGLRIIDLFDKNPVRMLKSVCDAICQPNRQYPLQQ